MSADGQNPPRRLGMRMIRLVMLIVGTCTMLLALGLVPSAPFAHAATQEADPQNRLLSFHLVDTDLLAKCAERHRAAIERGTLFSPEIRFSVLQLAASHAGDK